MIGYGLTLKNHIIPDVLKELKEKFKKFFGIDNQECWDIAFLKNENARYRKALEEVEEILEYYATSFIDPVRYPDVHYDTSCSKLGLDIISKAKGEE